MGTDSVAARGVIAVLGSLLIVFSLDPGIVRSWLTGPKNEILPTILVPGPSAGDAGSAATRKETPVETAKVEPPRPRQPEPTPAAANDFRNPDVSEISPSELRVSIEYTYIGDMGDSMPIVPSVKSNGIRNDAILFELSRGRPARVGTGAVMWTAYGDLATPWESDEIEFCFGGGRSRKFCETFPLKKRWPVMPRRDPVSRNQISNFSARELSDKELLVSVNYEYAAYADNGLLSSLCTPWHFSPTGSRFAARALPGLASRVRCTSVQAGRPW